MFTMTSIRIMGTMEQCAEAVMVLERVFTVLSVSKFYANRGTKTGRVYVEI